MIQAKSLVVYGTTGTRNGRKETTLAADIEKGLNKLLEDTEKVVGHSVCPLSSVIDAAIVTVLYEADDKPSKKK